MKKVLSLLVAIMLVFSLVACSNDEVADEKVEVLLFLHGNLGDLSFFDSAERGMDMIRDTYGDEVNVKTLEVGNDETKWEPALLDEADKGYDMIILGTWQMGQYVQQFAPDYPDTTFVLFDQSIDYSAGDFPNTYGLLFSQNEGSFLVGALAARKTETGTIGFLGGMAGPVINDFLVGYIEGAQYVDPDIKVQVAWIGNFYDSAKGKELALAQYNNGADIGFNVAGGGGLGQIDAAAETGNLVIGVDSDQGAIFGATDETKANQIMTSMLKNVDFGLAYMFDKWMDDTLELGTNQVLGLAVNGVGAVLDGKYTEALTTQDDRDFILDIQEQIVDGDIVVTSALEMSQADVDVITNSAK